ncbi:MAG: dTDP-4-amino-4,6-dideoxygalactose transaminase [Deltaproteobacteria bacterium]|jgi:dTDP-4-amino-4,6-dideoxygalactose transaminase|nr:dTDP-4-amino-4,6-dideoxygalactose transaminase [Deltaproteobacteria bacterium]
MKQNSLIDFNRPYMTGKELFYIAEAHFNGKLAGDGPFTNRCHAWLEKSLNCPKVLLTHSCTAALEMAALILDVKPFDEIIMPSFTFVSTANAFVLRGGAPVFVDIREDTLNIDERKIEEAITPKTKAIVPVHYAGVGCEMDTIMSLARANGLAVVEDAAQALLSRYKGQYLGTFGEIGTISFHETKNIISGEGGAITLNEAALTSMAEVFREKGTDRSRFFRGEVDKYTWQTLGSSFLPGELIAAFLWAQLEEAQSIIARRKKIWNTYHELLEPLEKRGILRRPIIPPECDHNAHIYYILLASSLDRDRVIASLRSDGVQSVFHYVPLHSSPGGRKYGRAVGSLGLTDSLASRLLRLPLWVGLKEEDQERVRDSLAKL